MCVASAVVVCRHVLIFSLLLDCCSYRALLAWLVAGLMVSSSSTDRPNLLCSPSADVVINMTQQQHPEESREESRDQLSTGGGPDSNSGCVLPSGGTQSSTLRQPTGLQNDLPPPRGTFDFFCFADFAADSLSYTFFALLVVDVVGLLCFEGDSKIYGNK